jgi:ankyrin repeat protein
LSLGFSGRDYWKRSIGITITTATFSTPQHHLVEPVGPEAAT